MKNLSYTLSCIKKDVYTFLFYFLHLSCSHSSHSLCYPSLGLSNSSLTLWLRAQPFLSGRCPFFRALHLGIKFSLHPASFLFGTQQHLTHPPVKSSTLPLRKVAPQHTIFTSYCIISLWDSATAHSPSSKELNLSSQEDACFLGCCTLAYNLHFILCHPSLGLSKSLLTLRQRARPFLSGG